MQCNQVIFLLRCSAQYEFHVTSDLWMAFMCHWIPWIENYGMRVGVSQPMPVLSDQLLPCLWRNALNSTSLLSCLDQLLSWFTSCEATVTAVTFKVKAKPRKLSLSRYWGIASATVISITIYGGFSQHGCIQRKWFFSFLLKSGQHLVVVFIYNTSWTPCRVSSGLYVQHLKCSFAHVCMTWEISWLQLLVPYVWATQQILISLSIAAVSKANRDWSHSDLQCAIVNYFLLFPLVYKVEYYSTTNIEPT